MILCWGISITVILSWNATDQQVPLLIPSVLPPESHSYVFIKCAQAVPAPSQHCLPVHFSPLHLSLFAGSSAPRKLPISTIKSQPFRLSNCGEIILCLGGFLQIGICTGILWTVSSVPTVHSSDSDGVGVGTP